MNKRSKEYDAFGPWIYIIDEEHTLPKLFTPYKAQLDGALMSFKIPRDIERRKANPDMNLYDAVIALYKTHIIILSRFGNSVCESIVKMSDIVAIKNSHFLLLGKLKLYSKDDFVEIKYNTVSVKIIEQFVDLILSNMDKQEQSNNLPFLSYTTETIDYLFAHLIDKQKEKDESIGLVAYQPKYEHVVKKDLISRLLVAFNKNRRIACTAFLSNAKEIIIINRASPLNDEKNEDFAYTYVYLPVQNITDAEILQADDEVTPFELHLSVFKHKFVTRFNEKNKSIKDLRDFLVNN